MSAEVVVCGAGIGGISLAHELAVGRGIRDVLLVDDHPPLSVTSDKSTECYRDCWPQPAMAALMARSIDRLDALSQATGNAFAMNRNGYVYVTGTDEGARALAAAAEGTVANGSGPLRRHGATAAATNGATAAATNGATAAATNGATAWPDTPWERLDPALRGADLTLDRDEVHARFPFLAPDARALLHARRCGWLSAQQLGMLLLEQAREAGVRLLRGRIVGVERDALGVSAVRVAGAPSGNAPGASVERVATRTLALAPGPGLVPLLCMCGLELPVIHELHAKVTFDDVLGVVPRHLPLMIWNDPVTLDWPDDERREIAADPELRALLGPLPPAVHFRPEGGAGSRKLLLLWAFDRAPVEPVDPPRFQPWLAEVVVRGMARMVPGFAAYLERMRRPFVDGGYYTKAPDNLLMLGATEVPGIFLLAALSGYGIMASQGAAELVADAILGKPAAPWAAAFCPTRFADLAYVERLRDEAAAAGQL